jgi:nitrile hydratase
MNGIHDFGGMQNFGAVVAEPNEPVFHADWERRVFAMTLAMGAWRRWNLDKSRSVREQMPPLEYLSSSYYEIWLYGLMRLLEETGLLDAEALRHVREAPESATAVGRNGPTREGALRPQDVARVIGPSRGTRMDDPVPPRFDVGQAVITRNIHPIGHTRLPRYARGRRGIVDRDHGVFSFPDTNARGDGTRPQHVYSVRFEARELWGPSASARDRVYIDLWDDYLEPA